MVWGALLLASSTAAAQQPARTTAAACGALMRLQVSGVALNVTKTEWFAAGAPIPGGRGAGAATPSDLPAYCRLDGTIDRRVGAAGVTYGIGFALALPENWNGRFLFQGGGGLNGSVQQPLGASAAGSTAADARAGSAPAQGPSPLRGDAAAAPLPNSPVPRRRAIAAKPPPRARPTSRVRRRWASLTAP